MTVVESVEVTIMMECEMNDENSTYEEAFQEDDEYGEQAIEVPEGGSKTKRIKPDGAVEQMKKTIRRRQNAGRRFDENTLCGVNGLAELAKHFDKWRAAPKQDPLDVVDSVMRQIEHWAHRMQPTMNFDDFLKRTQKLGHKKAVKLCLSRVRAGDDFDKPFVDESKQIKVDARGGEKKEEKEHAQASKEDAYVDLFDDDEFDFVASRAVESSSTKELVNDENAPSTATLPPPPQLEKKLTADESASENKQTSSMSARTMSAQDGEMAMSTASEKGIDEALAIFTN